jgi:hypothetical protein
MHSRSLLCVALVWTNLILGAPARAEESSAPERGPVAFEDALPEEPGSTTLRWVSDYVGASDPGGVSESSHRAQWFFGLAKGVSGELELPIMRFGEGSESTWGVGRAGFGLKVAPWLSPRWPVAIRAEAELPTASTALPEEARQSTGAMYLAGAVSPGAWTVQADLGYESTWDAADRSLAFDVACIRRLTGALGLHAEFTGERQLGGEGANLLLGPGLSLATSSGVTLGAGVLLGLNSASEHVRVVLALGRGF